MGTELQPLQRIVANPVSGGEWHAVTPVANAFFHFLVEFPSSVLSDLHLFRASLDSRAFDFWKDPGEDVYTLEDGEPI